MGNDEEPAEAIWTASSEQVDGEPQHLVWDVARRLTLALERVRARLDALLAEAGERAGHAVGRLRDVGDDLAYYLDPTPMVESLYTGLGLAPLSALAELDDRLDDLETRIEMIARERARGELLLLQARIAELEQILASVAESDTQRTMGDLVDKLGSLEQRIDAIRWPASGHQSRFPSGADR